jgi:hypothetical protein
MNEVPMKLHQLSLFLENHPGALKIPCAVLAEAGINMLALTLADTQEFGILRIIVKDWEKAREALTDAGLLVKVTEVVAIDVPQQPGGLLSALETLERADQAIEYMYAFAPGVQHGVHAALVFRFTDPEAAIAALSQAGFNAVAPAELFERMNA